MVNDEKAKLRTLLLYWITHNQEHSQVFREWADKVKGLGEDDIYDDMVQAAREMDKASESLSQALKRLEAKEL